MATPINTLTGFLQGDPSDLLESIAIAEIKQVKRALSERFYPPNRQVTLMLYYPLPRFQGMPCQRGFLADVAPHPNDGSDHPVIYQPADSGATGGFFQNATLGHTGNSYLALTASSESDLQVHLPIFEPRQIEDRRKSTRINFQNTHRAIYRHFKPGDEHGVFPKLGRPM